MKKTGKNEWQKYLRELYKDDICKILFNKKIETKEILVKDAYPKDNPRNIRVFIKTERELPNCVNSSGKKDIKTTLLVDLNSRNIACAFYNDNESPILVDFQKTKEFCAKGWKHK